MITLCNEIMLDIVIMTSQKNNNLLNYAAGSISGIVEVGVSHPIDRVKTEMQALALSKSNSTIKSAIRNIYMNDGINGFYSGIFPRIAGIIPMRLVYWGTLRTMNNVTVDFNKSMQYILPGLVAGSIQTIIDNPIEVFKVKLMTGAKNVNLTKLYDGFAPCLMRNVLFAIPVGISTKIYGKDNLIVAGAFGGLIGSIVSQPFDIIKTEMQRHKGTCNTKSQFQIVKELYNIHPLKLWTGVTMRATLGCVNMGVGYFVLEHIYQFLTRMNDL